MSSREAPPDLIHPRGGTRRHPPQGVTATRSKGIECIDESYPKTSADRSIDWRMHTLSGVIRNIETG